MHGWILHEEIGSTHASSWTKFAIWTHWNNIKTVATLIRLQCLYVHILLKSWGILNIARQNLRNSVLYFTSSTKKIQYANKYNGENKVVKNIVSH